MQLAFKCNAFAGRKDALEHAVKTIAEAGFKHVGLVFDKPYIWNQGVEEISNLLASYSLHAASISTCTASGFGRPDDDLTPPGQRFGPSFCSSDARERMIRIQHTVSALVLAERLDCRHIDISTGYQPKDTDHATTWRLTRNCLQIVCEIASMQDVSINIEYEPGEFGPGGLFVGSALSALAMCNDVGSPTLGVNLDLIHAAVCGEDIPATIRLLGDRLRVVEFDDMKSTRDANGILRRKHEHLIPGEGELAEQYPAIFEALEEIRYNGPITVELYNHFDKNPEEACRRSYEYLMKNFGSYFER